MYKRWQIGKILGRAVIALSVLLFLLFVAGMAFCGLKYVFHLDFTQDYRQIEEIEKLRFWNSWSGKVTLLFPIL